MPPRSAEVSPEVEPLPTHRERREPRLKLGEERPRGLRRDLVLDRDVRGDLGRILRRQPIAPLTGERLPQRDEFGGGKSDRDTAPEGTRRRRGQIEGFLLLTDRAEFAGDQAGLIAGKCMEQREVSRNNVALGREMPLP